MINDLMKMLGLKKTKKRKTKKQAAAARRRKAKSMRKCAYLEKTVSDLKRSMAEKNINCNLWKQKYQKMN